MKSFLWRLRSNAIWFLIAMVLFTVIYVWWAYAGYEYQMDKVYCLDRISPVVILLFTCFIFFLIYTKRYMYDEEYLYGHSRKTAFCSAQCCAALFSVLFALYAFSVALLVRRAILSASYIATSDELYKIPASDVLCNLVFIFVVNMLAFETANILRKFKTWKFWVSFIVCLTLVITMVLLFVLNPADQHALNQNNYWLIMISVFTAQLIFMIGCDFLLTRGRQYK